MYTKLFSLAIIYVQKKTSMDPVSPFIRLHVPLSAAKLFVLEGVVLDFGTSDIAREYGQELLS